MPPATRSPRTRVARARPGKLVKGKNAKVCKKPEGKRAPPNESPKTEAELIDDAFADFMKLDREQRSKEVGQQAMERVAQIALPQDISKAAREAFIWALDFWPSETEARELREELEAAHSALDLDSDAMRQLLHFDVNEALLAHAMYILD